MSSVIRKEANAISARRQSERRFCCELPCGGTTFRKVSWHAFWTLSPRQPRLTNAHLTLSLNCRFGYRSAMASTFP